jgi:hypothetical protein
MVPSGSSTTQIFSVLLKRYVPDPNGIEFVVCRGIRVDVRSVMCHLRPGNQVQFEVTNVGQISTEVIDVVKVDWALSPQEILDSLR